MGKDLRPMSQTYEEQFLDLIQELKGTLLLDTVNLPSFLVS